MLNVAEYLCSVEVSLVNINTIVIIVLKVTLKYQVTKILNNITHFDDLFSKKP